MTDPRLFAILLHCCLKERTERMRLDIYLTEHGYSKSRTKAKEYIERGLVSVDGNVVLKASCEVAEGECVCVTEPKHEYVGRGAHKLEGALRDFMLDVKGKKCIDVGASTGGFTDVLLRHGAESVCCVDSGHGQLAPSIASDIRVKNIEGCNARYMSADSVGDSYDIAVMDVSFISQTYIFPTLLPLLSEQGVLVSLVKPQFELERRHIGKGGIVKGAEARYTALLRVYEAVLMFGFRVSDAVISEIRGGDGNTEYLFMIERGEEKNEIREKLKLLAKAK